MKQSNVRFLGNYDGRFVYKILSPLTPKAAEKLLPETFLCNKGHKTAERLLKGRTEEGSVTRHTGTWRIYLPDNIPLRRVNWATRQTELAAVGTYQIKA
jgi:hypothetical protein